MEGEVEILPPPPKLETHTFFVLYHTVTLLHVACGVDQKLTIVQIAGIQLH